MGRWVSAEEHLRRALERADDPWITRNRAALESIRERIAEHVSELTVVANVAGATLSVNGTPAGALPLSQPVRVLVGSVVLDVTAEGHEPVRQTVRAEVGRTRAEVTLVPRVTVAATPPAPVIAPAPVVAPLPAPAPRLVIAPAPVVARRDATITTLGYVGLGLGAVGLGVGVLGVARVERRWEVGGGRVDLDLDRGIALRLGPRRATRGPSEGEERRELDPRGPAQQPQRGRTHR